MAKKFTSTSKQNVGTSTTSIYAVKLTSTQTEKQTVVIPFSLREQFNIANVIRFVQKTQDNFKEEK